MRKSETAISKHRKYILRRYYEGWDRLAFAFGGECQSGVSGCGNTGDLRMLKWCHIKPTPILLRRYGDGQRPAASNTLKDVEENPDCYMLLCANCDILVSGGHNGRPWLTRLKTFIPLNT
jgi:hypothetical protein